MSKGNYVSDCYIDLFIFLSKTYFGPVLFVPLSDFLRAHSDICIISMRETETFQGNTMQTPGRENFSYREKGDRSAKVNRASAFRCALQGLLPALADSP